MPSSWWQVASRAGGRSKAQCGMSDAIGGGGGLICPKVIPHKFVDDAFLFVPFLFVDDPSDPASLTCTQVPPQCRYLPFVCVPNWFDVKGRIPRIGRPNSAKYGPMLGYVASSLAHVIPRTALCSGSRLEGRKLRNAVCSGPCSCGVKHRSAGPSSCDRAAECAALRDIPQCGIHKHRHRHIPPADTP